MDDAKQQLVDRLKSSNNILVTVSRNPSVDQLSACLGLALLLNKQGKHTAAVFSGQVPSTLEFLQPEETLEKNTDSLRDFIIALDKSKADKLRYKVEDNVVRIFITPYRTSISEADLEFSQGDFNVDVVVAVGVTRQEDLDEAITAHGRILHDATVTSINTSGEGGLGSLNWVDPQASSLSELVTELAQALAPQLIDEQIATALLTGIVAETDRFSNDKTSPQTMSISAALMAAGANQQLVASKLEEPETPHIATAPATEAVDNPDGTIEIDHSHDPTAEDKPGDDDQDTGGLELPTPENDGPSGDSAEPEPVPEPSLQPAQTESVLSPAPGVSPPFDHQLDDDRLVPGPANVAEKQLPGLVGSNSKLVTGPPTLGGTLTANAQQERLDPVTDPMSLPNEEPPQLLERKPADSPGVVQPVSGWTPPPFTPGSVPMPAVTPNPAPAPFSPPAVQPEPSAPMTAKPVGPPSLSELETEVKQKEAAAGGLNDVRDEVSRALSDSAATPAPEPIQALNAQPLGGSLHTDMLTEDSSSPSLEDQIPGLHSPEDESPATLQVTNSASPPPVPPPIPFQFNAPQ